MNRQESIGKWFSATYRYLQIYINKEFEQYKIGSGQFQILLALHKNQGINQESIANILNLDKATVGRAVAKLEQVGYVKRNTDPKDHRAYILYLTQSGKQLIPTIRKSLDKLSSILLSDFTPNERDTALNLLKKMYLNMTNLENK